MDDQKQGAGINKKLFLERIYYHDPFSCIVLSVDLKGAVDIDRLRAAVESIFQKYEIFRVSVHQDTSGECYFVQNPNVDFLERILIIPPAERTEIIRKLVQIPFALEKGQTARVVLHKRGHGVRLFLCVHHIIADGMSALLLLEDMIRQYGLLDIKAPFVSIQPFDYPAYFRHVALDKRMEYILKLVRTTWHKKVYSHQEYLKMFREVAGEAQLHITEFCLSGAAYDKLIRQCKQKQITVTSYIAARIFEKGKVDILSLPVDMRENTDQIGNFISRIDISFKQVKDEKEVWGKAARIQTILAAMKSDKRQLVVRQKLLVDMDPTFMDSVLYTQYHQDNNKLANEVSHLLKFQAKQPLISVSNLKQAEVSEETDLQIDNLFFYPPAARERMATMGIVSLHAQMTITIQTFQGGTEL